MSCSSTIRRTSFSAFALLFLVSAALSAEEFRFRFTEGEHSRILSTVNETVYVNGEFSNQSEIVNRISVNVTEAAADGSSGTVQATFMTTENAMTRDDSTRHFIWGEEYESVFEQDQFGHYTIGSQYFMPTVRNVPVFSERDYAPGDIWYADGTEVYDLRPSFGIPGVFSVPFTAGYEYAGTTQIDGLTLHVIKVQYTVNFLPPVPKGTTGDYPVRTMGYVAQTIYWDNVKGGIHSYSEDFNISFETKRGNTVTYIGGASAEYARSEDLTDPEVLSRVEMTLNDLDIQDAAVTADGKGITVSLENIQFEPDSAELRLSEKMKLEKLGELLAAFPENDLLISGHTARAGSEEECQTLSEQRAQAVADYLKALGIKDEYHLFTRGFGSKKPVADNGTPEGMSRNRRVEITILQ